MNKYQIIGFVTPLLRASRAIRLVIVSLLGAALTASAQTSISWNNTGTDFATGTNWVNGVAPANDLTLNIASFPASPVSSPVLASSQSVAGLAFASGAGGYTFTGAGTLTLGSSGIVNAATSGTQQIALPLALGAASSFINSGAGNVTITGGVNTAGFGLTLDGGGSGAAIISGITGSGEVTKTGTGTWQLQLAGTNTYAGGTTVNNGTLSLAASNTLPSAGNIVVNATATSANLSLATGVTQTISTLTFSGATTTSTPNVTINSGATLTLNGNGTVTYDATNNPLTGNISGAGTLNLGGNQTFNVGNTSTSGSDLVIGTTITDGGAGYGIIKTGVGVLKLTNTVSYSGVTTINNGEIYVSGINNVLPTTGSVVVAATSTATPATLSLYVNGTENGFTQTIGPLTLGGAAGTNSDVSVGGNITNSTSNTLVLGGTVTYDATLNPGSSSISGAGTLDLGGNRIFNVGHSTTGSDLSVLTAIIGSGDSLTKTGPGKLSLSGNNTYTGGTAINGGTLVLNAPIGANAIGTTGTISFGGGSLQFTANNTADYSARFSNAASQAFTLDTNGQNVTLTSGLASTGGSLTKLGAGTLTLSGASTYDTGTAILHGTLATGANNALPSTGNVTIDEKSSSSTALLQIGAGFSQTIGNLAFGGTGASASSNGNVTIGSGSTLTIGGGTVTYNNTDSPLTATINGSGALALGTATTTFNVTSSSNSGGTDLSISAPITDGAGASGLVKTGTGVLSLSGANTYTGGTTINRGTLATGANNALLSTGNVTINELTASSTALLQIGAGFSQTIGNLTFGGTGAASSTSTNNVTIGSGSTFTIGGGTVTYNNTDSPLAANINGSGALALGNTTTTFNVAHSSTNGSGSDLSISTPITDGASASGLVKTGAGTLNITGVNTYTGGTTINQGTLLMTGGSLAGNVVINALTATNATLQIGSPSAASIGTLTFGGASDNNTATNAIALNGGTLTLGGTVTYDATNNPKQATIGSGGSLVLGATTTFNITHSTGSTGSDLSISSPISDGGNAYGLVKTGTGELILANGANTYSGGTTINGGTLQLNTSGALASGKDVTVNSTVSSATANFTLATGTQTIGNLTLGGGTTSSTPIVVIASGATLTVNGNVTYNATNNPISGNISSGTLDLGGGTRTFSVGNTTTSNSDLFVSSTISDGALTKTGAGVLKLTGSSTYTGTTTINDGQIFLSPASGTALVSGANIIINETNASSTASLLLDTGKTQMIGTLTLGGSTSTSNATVTINSTSTLTLGGNVTYDASGNALSASISGSGTLALGGDRTFNIGNSTTVGSGTDLTISSVISGSGNLTKTGAGQLSLNAANTYTGNTTINDGPLRLGLTSGNALPTTSNIYVNETNGGTNAEFFLGTNVSQTVASLTFGGAGGTSTATNTAFIASGTLTMGGPITYDATSNPLGATISGTTGTLALGSSQTIAVGSSSNASIGLTISVPISGTGFTKTGSGSLALSGINTLTGATVVSAGSLFVNNTGGSGVGTSTLEIQTGAILRGFGFIGGATTVDSGASISPGSAGSPATLTLSNGLTLNSGGVFNFQLGTVSDKIAVTGGVLTGNSGLTINLSDSGGFAAGTYPLFDFSTGSTTTSNFLASDFTLGTTIAGYTYSLAESGNMLELTATSAIPEPSTYAALTGLAALGLAAWRRRRQRTTA